MTLHSFWHTFAILTIKIFIYSLALCFISVYCVERKQRQQKTDRVLTQTIVIMSKFKSRIAETVIGPNSVFTSPISTWMPLTLVYICRRTLGQSIPLLTRKTEPTKHPHYFKLLTDLDFPFSMLRTYIYSRKITMKQRKL